MVPSHRSYLLIAYKYDTVAAAVISAKTVETTFNSIVLNLGAAGYTCHQFLMHFVESRILEEKLYIHLISHRRSPIPHNRDLLSSLRQLP